MVAVSMLPTSDYRERRPPAGLRRHFVCIWSQAIGHGGADYPQRVLPDGCIDILWIGESAPVIVGPATRMFVARLTPGSLVIGARLRPGMAPGVLGLPACAALNREVPLDLIWRRTDHLNERLAEQPGTEARLAVLEVALVERVADAKACDPLVEAGVASLASSPSGRVSELCLSAGISERQLRRRFEAAVGYGPKTLARILRLQRTLALHRAGGGRSGLAGLAAEAGYADQAHMSRDFAELAGAPPGVLLPQAQSALALSDLFNTAAHAAH
jgi:AraC-like DNA-binding protein